ncbi:MAG: LytR C-terminal domain-containing protein [Desulfobulbaceae bacterium]|nr:LytR C-terminal domain-containing protein [Candidatus Kapabacteria bacterium]MBS3999909.1 LytR C-terminal domain-containing protein [Desulfobulbaceae bacterium]
MFGNIVKYLNLAIIFVLTGAVALLLSSFIDRVFISPPVSASLSEDLKSNKQEVIQINILNASGEAGLAARAKEYLRGRGFDVVEIGNYSENLDKSIIIDRLGDINSAYKVAYAVGITDSLITSQIDSSLFLRSSIILGKDFALLKPFK